MARQAVLSGKMIPGPDSYDVVLWAEVNGSAVKTYSRVLAVDPQDWPAPRVLHRTALSNAFDRIAREVDKR